VLTVAGARVAELKEGGKAPDDWQVTYEGNLVYFTPLHEDIPATSAVVTARMPDGTLVPHVLELNTRSGGVHLPGADRPEAERAAARANTMFMLTFRYPRMEAEKQAAERRARAAERAASAAVAARAGVQATAADRLRQDVFYGQARNWKFLWRCQNKEPDNCGNDEIRPLEISDNGLMTAVQFAGTGARPVPYIVEEDGTEAVVSFNMAREDLMLLHVAPKLLRFRRNGLVGDALNVGHKSIASANPMTGTTSPGVVRMLRTGAPR
jgi:type IV secretory pathway VirB9-like protein